MTDAIESQRTEAMPNKRRKKAAVIAGSIGVLGVAGAFAFANWTDSESIGATFSGGEFDLEVAVEKNGDGDWIWQSDTDAVDFADLADGNPALSDPWGPGDVRAAEFAVRLDPDTTHNAAVTSAEFGDLFDGDFDITVAGIDSFTLNSNGTPVEFTVTFAAESSLEQEEVATGGWTFTATQQSVDSTTPDN
ncbi:hypothetical protein [Sediminivirga luteola]|uniref:Ribosomally synthesized peptide with SipW-like signal peptide n=1 Tax=Sediminivirga luteola TaxID=1774748 RepID=A0A8J2U1D6_9MICO|nr:hypothetical protein [Sediminivirga luteola]GGA28969.1 hypothetical protein GCM10011333_34510 [Sediminivirga luteola]